MAKATTLRAFTAGCLGTVTGFSALTACSGEGSGRPGDSATATASSTATTTASPVPVPPPAEPTLSQGRNVPGRQPYLDAAKKSAQDITTVSYQSVDADVQRVLDGATGAFYESFSSRSEQFKQVVRDAQSTSSGAIIGARLESMDGTRAQVLVTVTVHTRNVGQPDPEPRAWRMLITVDKVGDAYKTSKLAFMP